jgi:hypothetical protein
MANYINPIGTPNPFLASHPVVFVVRHVRQTASGELVMEDANALPRFLRRIANKRSHPIAPTPVPLQRNLPTDQRLIGAL